MRLLPVMRKENERVFWACVERVEGRGVASLRNC